MSTGCNPYIETILFGDTREKVNQILSTIASYKLVIDAITEEVESHSTVEAVTFADPLDIDASTVSRIWEITLTANLVWNAPTNLRVGRYVIIVNQDGVGGHTITWDAVFNFPGGTAPTLTAAAAAKDILVFESDGTNLYLTSEALNQS